MQSKEALLEFILPAVESSAIHRSIDFSQRPHIKGDTDLERFHNFMKGTRPYKKSPAYKEEVDKTFNILNNPEHYPRAREVNIQLNNLDSYSPETNQAISRGFKGKGLPAEVHVSGFNPGTLLHEFRHTDQAPKSVVDKYILNKALQGEELHPRLVDRFYKNRLRDELDANLYAMHKVKDKTHLPLSQLSYHNLFKDQGIGDNTAYSSTLVQPSFVTRYMAGGLDEKRQDAIWNYVVKGKIKHDRTPSNVYRNYSQFGPNSKQTIKNLIKDDLSFIGDTFGTESKRDIASKFRKTYQPYYDPDNKLKDLFKPKDKKAGLVDMINVAQSSMPIIRETKKNNSSKPRVF